METKRPNLFIAELCTSLDRAYRTVRFYPPEHGVATQALGHLAAVFCKAMAERRSLRLEIRDGELLYKGAVVYSDENLRDNLAFLMFRDGVRAIEFHSGVENDEISAFVRALAQSADTDEAEHDVTTLLWEQDFAHIDYEVSDLLMEAEADSSDTVECVREGVAQRLGAGVSAEVLMAVESQAMSVATSTVRRDARVGDLTTTEDMAAIEQVIAEEHDVLDEFALVLSEVLISAPTEQERCTARGALEEVLCSLAEWGETALLCSTLRRLETLEEMSPQHASDVEGVICSLCRADRLGKVVLALDGPRPAPRDEVDDLLRLLRGRAYPALVELLVEADGQAARKCLLNVLSEGDGVPLEIVEPHMRDPRWYVVRNMLYLLGTLRDPAVVDHLERGLRHPDERVRREAVRALGAHDGIRVQQLLTGCLNDPSASVRVLAIRGMGKSGGEAVVEHLLRTVAAKDFASRPESETDSLLDALAEVGDDRAVPVLDQLWERRTLFRAKPQPIRLKALRTLGRLGTPLARQSLARAAHAGDEAVRRQAALSLAEADRRAVTV